MMVVVAGLRLGQRPVFTDAENGPRMVLTGYVVLPVVMLLASPLIWEHHFVMWMLTMPVVAASLKHPREWWLLLPVYVFCFLMPTYDIYPLSYLRLLGMILIVILLSILAARDDDGEPEWLRRLNAWAQLAPRTLLER